MCGIAGIIHLDGSTVDQAQLDTLTDALAHRGPDGRGTFIDHAVGFGHRRLSILDLTEAGKQPMMSDDQQIVITFNGEMYNFQKERSELEAKGYRFHSHCDTEVLLKLYEEYGEDCLQRIRGMFAFAIFDRRKQKVFMARDRLGKKPLKYFHNGNVFAFASELKALHSLPECPREVDREALHHYLTLMYMPAPLTGFEGIYKLPAAHCMTIDLKTGEKHMRRYWQLEYKPEEGRTEEEWWERILPVLEESVRLRMIADVPVGAFLSSGIDSSLVVALMAKQSSQPINTFSIGSDDPAMNELPGAAMVAAKFGTHHRPIDLRADIVHLLPELVNAYEEPYADPSSIPTYLLAREARKDVTVALNGDGGDENFGGYVRYPIALFSERWARVPSPIHALVRGGTSAMHAMMGTTLSYRMKRFEHSMDLPWERRFLQYISFFTEEEKSEIYTDGFASTFSPTDLWYRERTVFARTMAPDTLHKAMSMDIDTYLADDLLPKVDIGTMAHGLEARSPLLDHTLLELTAKLPASMQIHGKTTKWLLRKSLQGTLPDEILFGRKRGFRLPLDRWFRNELSSWVQSRLLEETNPLFCEMFDRNKLEKFLSEYQSSRVNYADHVWSLLWLAEWCRRYA